MTALEPLHKGDSAESRTRCIVFVSSVYVHDVSVYLLPYVCVRQKTEFLFKKLVWRKKTQNIDNHILLIFKRLKTISGPVTFQIVAFAYFFV